MKSIIQVSIRQPAKKEVKSFSLLPRLATIEGEGKEYSNAIIE